MKRWKSAIILCLCLALVLAGADRYEITASASGLTNDSIRQKEEEIKKAKEEKKSLQSGLTNVKELKKQLEASKANLANYIEELDAFKNQICATGAASSICPIRSRRTFDAMTSTPHFSQTMPRCFMRLYFPQLHS